MLKVFQVPSFILSSSLNDRKTFVFLLMLFRLWGAQTQRSLQNFEIGGERERMPEPIIRAFGILKKCATKVAYHFALFHPL